MTPHEARSLKVGDRIQWHPPDAAPVEGSVHTVTGVSMVSIKWDGGDQMTHHDPYFMDDYSIIRQETPPPTPHARKRPDITLAMLEALKDSVENNDDGGVIAAPGTRRALIRRGLADPVGRGSIITESGRLLIRTQYDALFHVLSEASHG